MSKIREAYLQRCEIGLLACERNEGLRLCRENDIVRYGLYREGDSVAVPRIFTARKTRYCHSIFIIRWNILRLRDTGAACS